jgi:hypothetical protein
VSNQLYNGGRGGRTQNNPTMKSAAKIGGSHKGKGGQMKPAPVKGSHAK